MGAAVGLGRGRGEVPGGVVRSGWLVVAGVVIRREEIIGDCRLLLGDAREIVPALDYDAIASDPPFGMSFRSNHRIDRHRPIANDTTDDLLQWTCSLPVRHSAYIFARWDNLRNLPHPTSLVTWVKNNWSMGDLDHEHARQTEVCLFFRGPDHFFPNGRPQDVIRCARSGNENHPTEKPVGLMQAVVGWTDGVVLDPFMGSGTTLVAASRLGRSAIGIELDPTYYETALRRVDAASRAPDMFIERPAAPVQEPLL
jgi:site-specific DNA-methyltransferase (adenine-specific)